MSSANSPLPLVSTDPATGAVVGQVEVTPPEEVPAVVARARAAQPAWRDLGLKGRRELLEPAGVRIVEQAAELGLLACREMGKPRGEAVGEVRHCGTSFAETLDELVAALSPHTVENERVRSEIRYEPHGVCAAITPWNFPVMMPHWLVVPALMAGNAVVLKPSEETPLCGQAYAELLGADLPLGVLQVVHGADAQGKALVAADVDLVAFTGSREAGRHILQAAGAGLKRVLLELGGKDPMVVLDDADVGEAAAFAARSSFRNAGQVCISTERIYVHEAIASAFEEALAAEAARLSIGPGTEEGADGDDVDLGPLVNARQKELVVAQVREALADGAASLTGDLAGDGNFLRPVVLGGVTHAMRIMRDETFGPVACVMRYGDVDEAVRLANDTPYGLGAVVFGKDAEKAQAVARRIDAGMVGVNRACGGIAGTPWVGAKQSGYGFHSSADGHRQFAVPRVLTVGKQD